MTGNSVPLYTYVTDITVQEEWLSKKTDFYFVGADTTKNSLLLKGVPPDKILVSGIPVKQCFKEKEKHIKPKEKVEILIMGGGLGLIPSSHKLLKKLCNLDNLHITMIAGKNVKLMKKIKNRFPQIDVIGFTEDVYSYMKKADLLITKSGGITTFEAINSLTPLYIIKPFLTQEVGNAKYIEQHSMGKVVWSNRTDIAEDIIALIESGLHLQIMKKNMEHIQRSWTTSSPLKVFYERGVL